MKKIGVITWFRYENYGTALQAIALQEYLRSQNFLPSLIETPNVKVSQKGEKKTIFFRLKRKLLIKAVSLMFGKYLENRSRKFKEIIYKNYDVKSVRESFSKTCNKFDLLICGSDQIWNPNWYNDYYFANFPKIVTPKISYAPSIGVDHLPLTLLGTYYNSLCKFKKLSVREKSSQEDIQNILGINCEVVVDPVLLLPKKKWLSLIDQDTTRNKNYVFCYFLGENNNHWKAAQSYAKKHGLKLKTIPMQPSSYLKKGKKLFDAGPLDFLESIANANIIFTDSFHASVFSIIFKKPFYVFERTPKNKKGSQNTRIYNLLEVAGLEERMINFNSKKIVEKSDIDYSVVLNRLDSAIRDSKEYLNDSILESN